MVITLGGEDARLTEGVDDAPFVRLESKDAAITIDMVRQTPAEAFESMAIAIAEMRLTQYLTSLGWMDIKEVIDETTYLLALDSEGVRWAIGVAPSGSELRSYLERDMRINGHATRMAFVEPLDTRNPAALQRALERAANEEPG